MTYHGRKKYVDIDKHFVKERIGENVTELVYSNKWIDNEYIY